MLTKSVLSTIPLYVMLNHLLPRRVLDPLDRVSKNFIWGTTQEKLKLHMVSCEKITSPKEHGGLGIQAARPKNMAMLAKLHWRYKTEKDKFWVKVLSHKYENPKKSLFLHLESLNPWGKFLL